MRKYYLFIINNNSYKLYKNNPKLLYTILDTLYNLKENNINYGLNLYNQICDTFSVKLLNSYIKEKYKHKILKNNIIKLINNNEVTSIQIRYSTTIVLTNKNIPKIFKILNIYNKKIFR